MAVACLAGILAIPGTVGAQEIAAAAPQQQADAAPQVANTGGLEEITVTAERRSENLQDAPLSVSAVTPEQLEQDNTHSVRDLGMAVTSLYIPRSSINPSTAAYFIRGVGEADAVQSGAIGIYLDDVFLPRGLGSNYGFSDTEQVEVLKGPQGTLYGRNTNGGAVKITTSQPTDDFHFYQENGIGNYGQFTNRSGVNIALNDWTDLRVDFVHQQRDGTTHDFYTGGDTRDIDSNAAQIKALFKFNNDVHLTLSARGLLDNSTGGSVGSSIWVPGGVLATLGIPRSAVPPRSNYAERTNSVNHMQEAMAAANLVWNISPNYTFKSITSYQEMRQPGQYDTDLTPAVLSELTLHHRDHLGTQEFQLAGNFDNLNYVSGLYFFHETFNSYRITTTTTATNQIQSTDQLGSERINSVAPFGQATYKVTDDIDLIGGLRYTFEHRDFHFTYGTTRPAYNLGQSDASHSWNSVTPKLGVDYHFSPDILTYASYSEGYKAGGYDNRSTSLLAATRPYEPEVVNAWEIGVKNELFDHRVRLNVAAFYNDYSNFQATASDPATNTSLRVNAGDAVTRGFDLESTWAALDGLTITDNISYLAANVTKGKDLISGALVTGNRLPDSPRWSFSNHIDYVVPLEIPGSVSLSATTTFQTAVFTDLQNSEIGKTAPEANLDLNATYATEDGHWLAGIAVQNVADSTYSQGGSASGTGTKAYATTNYNEPRLVSFRVKYTY